MRNVRHSIVLVLVGTANQASAIATTVTTVHVPAPEIASAIVRVHTGDTKDSASFSASGTVIDIRPDKVGDGGWICVLTADHVIHDGGNGDWLYYGLGFGDLGGTGYYTDTPTAPIKILRGPTVGTTSYIADIALMGIRIPDLKKLPKITLPGLKRADVGSTIYMGGFGDNASFIPGDRRYKVTPGSFGSLAAGFNGVDKRFTLGDSDSVQVYVTDVNEMSVDFKPDDPVAPTDGEAYVLGGDSGGPSWQYTTSGWDIIGVHHASKTHTIGPDTFVFEHDDMTDADVGSYKDWITKGCDTLAVPEPASIVALAAGLVAALRRRR